jgi:nitroreductase
MSVAEQERDGAARAPAEGGFNAVEDVIYRRRSVRYYQKEPVPEGLVRRVLEAGRFAPSAGNAQPWKSIVVRDPAMIAEMTEDVVTFCRRVMWMVDYLTPGRERREWLAKLLQRLRNNDLHPIPFGAMRLIAEGQLGVWHGASTVIIILTDHRSPGNPYLDAGIAGQNMVLAANSLGLGSCWVSFVKPLNYSLKWRKRLGLRHPYKLASSIALGYAKGKPDAYVHRETQAVDWFEPGGSFRVVY